MVSTRDCWFWSGLGRKTPFSFTATREEARAAAQIIPAIPQPPDEVISRSMIAFWFERIIPALVSWNFLLSTSELKRSNPSRSSWRRGVSTSFMCSGEIALNVSFNWGGAGTKDFSPGRTRISNEHRCKWSASLGERSILRGESEASFISNNPLQISSKSVMKQLFAGN